MAKSTELIERYERYEARHGADAPVAMLRWCLRANQSMDEQAQALANVIKDLLWKRALAEFNAEDSQEAILARQECADETRRIVHLAFVVETMAPRAGDEIE